MREKNCRCFILISSAASAVLVLTLRQLSHSFYYSICELLVTTCLVFAALSDICTYKVTNEFIPYLLSAGLPMFIAAAPERRRLNIILAIILLLCGYICTQFFKADIGGADIKICSALLLFSGPLKLFTVFFTACLAASFFSCIIIIYELFKKKTFSAQPLKIRIPFVPFILLGYYFVISPLYYGFA